MVSSLTQFFEGCFISQFPAMVCQMIAVGEQSGAIDTMLNKIADFYDAEIETTVDSLTSLLEPALIVFLGVVFPVLFNAYIGAKQTPRLLIDVGRVFGYSHNRLFTTVVMPAALPYLIAGIRIGVTLGIILIAAESIATQATAPSPQSAGSATSADSPGADDRNRRTVDATAQSVATSIGVSTLAQSCEHAAVGRGRGPPSAPGCGLVATAPASLQRLQRVT